MKVRDSKIWKIYGKKAEKQVSKVSKWLQNNRGCILANDNDIVDFMALMMVVADEYGHGDALAGLVLANKDIIEITKKLNNKLKLDVRYHNKRMDMTDVWMFWYKLKKLIDNEVSR